MTQGGAKRKPAGWKTLTERQKEKHAKRVCVSRGCRNRSQKARLLCCTCRSRDYTARNPVRIKYLNLKKSAKRRGIPFHVTWPYFKALANERGYNKFTPKIDADTLSVDRVREDGPYSDTNIEIIPLGPNSKKAHDIRKGMRMAHIPYFASMREVAA